MKQSLEDYFTEHPLLQNSINQCVLFNALDESATKEVYESSKVVKLKQNETLFCKGDELNYIYLLLEGGMKLQILAPSGDEKIIDVIRAGQTFAEAVLFSGALQYPVTAVASSDSMVVAVNAKKYRQLLHDSNRLCLAILAKLSQRLHWMVNEVDQLTLHNATYRLINYLLSQVSHSKDIEQPIINLSFSKKVLASRLSIQPETLSRIFKRLVKDNLIEREDMQIKLLDIHQLQQLLLI